MREFSFADVLTYSVVTRSQAIHLTAKRVIVPDIGESEGTGHPRRFSFYNLIEFDVAAGFVGLGVEHYAVAQVLRRLRWLIGDPNGFESWAETLVKTPRRQRDRFDRRLLWVALDPIFQFSAEWLNDPAPDLSSLDADQRQFVESVRARVKPIKPNRSGPPSASEALAQDRAIRAMLRELPYAQVGIRKWQEFSSRQTRPSTFFLVAWATRTEEYQQWNALTGITNMTQARWVFDLAKSPDDLSEIVAQSCASVVIDLHAIVAALEESTGERLEDTERERLNGSSGTAKQRRGIL
jgi:hypothetical protein